MNKLLNFFIAATVSIIGVMSLSPGAAYSFSSDIIATDQADLKFVVGDFSETKDNKKYLNAGLYFKLKDKWKVYWRSPGDVGLPVSFNWEESENIDKAEILWPVPERFADLGNIESVGYKDEVLIPARIFVEDITKNTQITVKVNYAICSNICILEEAAFNFEILPGHSDYEAQELIDEYLSKVPKQNNSNGISITKLDYIDGDLQSGNGDSGNFIITAISKYGFDNPEIFIEGPADYRFSKSEVKFVNNRQIATFIYKAESIISGRVFPGGQVGVTLADGSRAVEHVFHLPSKILKKEILGYEFDRQVIFISIMAFLGGLILNVMPCVLPVLSIKLVGVISHSGSTRKVIRSGFMASAFGILISFQLLALVVILLKSAGTAVGWGFHFQEPAFVIALILIVSFFAASMMDLIDINLPNWLGDLLHQKAHPDEASLFGSFLSGVLATILATPCTAPFLGTAVGFALSSGYQQIIWTFFFMGLGLAAPYIFFGVFPHLVKKLLPKPGPWMQVIKYIMGVFLILTALWLIWVLYGQLGQMAALVMFCITSIILFIFWVIDKEKFVERNKLKMVLIAVIISLAFYLPFAIGVDKAEVSSGKPPGQAWQEFNEAKIDQFVSKGKIVFVDVTADWCLTCKANHLFVLSDSEVSTEIFGPEVVAMRADWTSKNSEITTYLRSHNRYGIPFNVVYGPAVPEGVLLPELLTKTEVLEALSKVRGEELIKE